GIRVVLDAGRNPGGIARKPSARFDRLSHVARTSAVAQVIFPQPRWDSHISQWLPAPLVPGAFRQIIRVNTKRARSSSRTRIPATRATGVATQVTWASPASGTSDRRRE